MIGRLLLALAAAIALIGVLVEWRLLDRGEATPEPVPARPGYYLTGIDLEEFGDDGRPRIGMQAATAVEEPATGQVTLHEVTVDYRALEGQDWRLTSVQARVPRGGDVVEFDGDVRMNGQSDERPEITELRTAHLTLDTDRERANTPDTVTLSFGQHVVRARGLQADLKAGSLRLESDVNGLFTR
jgi:LPS export ABC transporter protein LptC